MDAGNQIFIFLVCVSAGMVGGVIYDVFYLCRKLCGERVVLPFDLSFFLLFAALCVFVAVLFSFPDFRVYMYLGNLLGLILYLKSVHLIVAFFFRICYNKAGKAVKRRKIAKKSRKQRG